MMVSSRNTNSKSPRELVNLVIVIAGLIFVYMLFLLSDLNAYPQDFLSSSHFSQPTLSEKAPNRHLNQYLAEQSAEKLKMKSLAAQELALRNNKAKKSEFLAQLKQALQSKKIVDFHRKIVFSREEDDWSLAASRKLELLFSDRVLSSIASSKEYFCSDLMCFVHTESMLLTPQQQHRLRDKLVKEGKFPTFQHYQNLGKASGIYIYRFDIM